MDIIKSDIVSLHGVAASMIGGRQENQDDWAYLDTPLGFLIIVCDGMGGGPGGKTASYIVKHEFALTICECRPQTSREHALKLATARAHQALEDKMKETPALSGMGSTFVAALFNRQSVVIAHAGDSRCYRIHGKKCMFRTQDHSLVAELVRKKVMTEEEARQSPQANVITRGLGSTNNHVPEIEEIPYKKGDRFILCTDGVWGTMRHQDFLELLTQHINIQSSLSSVSTKVDAIGFAQGGGHDNHTIAIIELKEDSLLKEKILWKRWIIIFSFAVFFIVTLYCILTIFEQLKNKGVFFSQVSELRNLDNQHDNNNTYKIYYREKGVEDSEYTNKGWQDILDSVENYYSSIPNEVNGDDSTTNIAFYERLLQREGGVHDSVSIQHSNNGHHGKATIVSKSLETTQKIINRYDSAKVGGSKILAEAKANIEEKRKAIKILFDELMQQTEGGENYQTVKILSNVVDAYHAWDIYKEPDPQTKLYGPTKKAKEHMDKQIKRLRELKKSFEKELDK